MKSQDPRTVLRALELYLYNVSFTTFYAGWIGREDIKGAEAQQMCEAWHRSTQSFPTFIGRLGHGDESFLQLVMDKYADEAARDIVARVKWDKKIAAVMAEHPEAVKLAILDLKDMPVPLKPSGDDPPETGSALQQLIAADLKPKTAADRQTPLPCPFGCKEDNEGQPTVEIAEDDPKGWHVVCPHGCTGPWSITGRAEAVAMWNAVKR